jgi:DNA polymerase-3 subunit delta'
MMKLTDIFGQDAAIQALRKAYQADRMPHGLIFAGPGGVGKASTAAALAAFFLCEKPKSDDACGACESCRAISTGAHPDYHIITKELARLHDKSGTSKATQIAINVIRHELNEPASRKTTMGRGKVFVIEQAELMTTAAQNALLKTLEEPYGRALIILLTETLSDLLPTVRSRCQVIRFVSLEAEVVKRELLKRGVDREAAQQAAELSDGSLGTALRFIQDGVLQPASAMTTLIDSALSGNTSGDIADLLRKSAEALTEKTMERDELASKDSVMRNSLSVYLSIAARRLRQRMADGADPQMLEQICQAVDSIARAEKYLDANVNVALTLAQLGLSLQPVTA